MNYELGLIYYNLRCKDYQSARNEVTHILDRSVNESEQFGKLKFWKACTSGFCGLHQEAIHNLETLRRSHRHLEFAIISALVWFQQKADFVDEDELRHLEVALKTAQSHIHIDGALLAADFYLHIGDYDSTSICLAFPAVSDLKSESDMVLRKVNSDRCRIQLRLNIIYFKNTNDRSYLPALPTIEGYVFDEEDVECIMTQAKYHEYCGDQNSALKLLRGIIVKDDTYYPALIEISKIQFCLGRYSLAFESAKRAIKIAKRIEALLVVILTYYHATICTAIEHKKNLNQLTKLLSKSSKPHVHLCIQSVKLLCQLCGNSDSVTLESALSLISIAEALDPTDSTTRLEKARILQRLGNYAAAIHEYQSLLILNACNVEVSLGMVLCHLFNDNNHDAKEQLEFVELSREDNCIIEWQIIDMYFAKNKKSLFNAFCTLFDNLLRITKSKGRIRSDDLFDISSYVNIGCIIESIWYYLSQWPMGYHDINGMKREDEWAVVTKQIDEILKLLVERHPSNEQSWILLSKFLLQRNLLNEAKEIVQNYVSSHSNSGLAHLTKAQIELVSKNTIGSHESLEQALSRDFDLRYHPIYCLVKGSVCFEQGLMDQARTLLFETIKHDDICQYSFRCGKYIISLDDRVSSYISLINTLTERNELNLLKKVSLDAEEKFKDLPKAFYFVVFKCHALIKNGNMKKALQILADIPITSSYFLAAQLQRLKIYLDKEGDINSFIQCHESLMNLKLDQQPQLYMALGSAYDEANFYKLALQCYSRAFVDNHHDVTVACCVGKMLIRCHQYQQASEHYLSTLSSMSGNIVLRLELATVFTKMLHITDAQHILDDLIVDVLRCNDSQYLHKYISLVLKLVNVQVSLRSNIQGSELLLETIRLIRTHRELLALKPLLVEQIRLQLSYLISNIFSCDTLKHNFEDSMKLLKASIEGNDNDEKIFSVMINTLYKHQRYDDCRKYCEKSCILAQSHEDIIVVSCKLFMTQLDLNQAYIQFQSYLNNHSDCFKVVYHFLPLLKRMDKCNEMTTIVENLKQECLIMKCNGVSGWLSLCLGLYHRLTDSLPLALEKFNHARCSVTTRKEACLNMIEIYLGLDDYDFWTKPLFKSTEKISPCVIRSLNELFRSLNGVNDECRKIETYKGYFKLIATFDSNKMEKASEIFSSILTKKKNFVPALLGNATVFWQQGNDNRLRSILKRIAKLNYDFEHWKEYERSYLLLASIYLERNEKLELSLDLCKRCLFHNKACTKAWEIMGTIMRRKGDYTTAIDCYLQVAKFDNRSSLRNLSNLAILHFKSKRFSEAITICTEIMKQQPDYPRAAELLENCILSIRP